MNSRSQGARDILIFTDDVFSMEGTVAQLDRMRMLADQYGALLGVDNSRASEFVGRTGRRTHEVAVITGTLGRALGGAGCGFTSGTRELVELLRECSRAYLFSNFVAPSVVGRRRGSQPKYPPLMSLNIFRLPSRRFGRLVAS